MALLHVRLRLKGHISLLFVALAVFLAVGVSGLFLLDRLSPRGVVDLLTARHV